MREPSIMIKLPVNMDDLDELIHIAVEGIADAVWALAKFAKYVDEGDLLHPCDVIAQDVLARLRDIENDALYPEMQDVADEWDERQEGK